MTTPSILRKIKNLRNFALSPTANEHEAHNANAKIQELLILHNLSLADLPEEESQAVETHTVLKSKKIIKWKKTLLLSVALFYDCQLMQERTKENVYQSIIGSQGNIAVALLMYEYFEKALERVVDEEIKLGRVDITPTFRNGIALRISAKLRERKQLINREGFSTEIGNVSSLVVMQQSERATQDINKWIEKHCAGVKEVKYKIKPSNDLQRGYAVGDRIGVDPQINGDQRQPQMSTVVN